MQDMQSVLNQLRIRQVAIIVRDIEKTTKHFSTLFNWGPFQFRELDLPDAILHGKKTPLKAKLAFVDTGPIELELIEPGEGKSIYWEFLNTKGEGVHHFAIFVIDLEKELIKWNKNGIEVLQSGDTPNVRFAYLNTENIFGIIVELVQHKQYQTPPIL